MNAALVRAQLASPLSPRFMRLKAARELARSGTLAGLRVLEEVLASLDGELVDCLLDHWPASGRHELCALLLEHDAARERLDRRLSDESWLKAAARSLLHRPDDRLAEGLLASPPRDP
ncbi:MAG: hypothetical protein AB1758_12445, partial [Candidatus Eremiobacterota bacterium]